MGYLSEAIPDSIRANKTKVIVVIEQFFNDYTLGLSSLFFLCSIIIVYAVEIERVPVWKAVRIMGILFLIALTGLIGRAIFNPI